MNALCDLKKFNNKLPHEDSKLTARPPFPPKLTAYDLIPTEVSSKAENVRIPNAFIAYRMALVRELKSQKVASHRSNVSTYASRLWAEEPEHVKETYRKMANDATILHNKSRGITFLCYEQCNSNEKCKKRKSSVLNENITQNIEPDIPSLKIQPQIPQQVDVMMTPPQSDFDQSYFNNNSMANQTFQAVNRSNVYDQNMANPIGMNPFCGNLFGNRLSLEQRVQNLEHQMAIFHQMCLGGFHYQTT
ncbi:13360_t:CDS:1 [Funneliformis geosporum]|uniref:17577_t:CDS:1 n=1 Tax=Funneliformis geosporum TaxID=1117311 RepID=A0A9W4SNW3_9GLOM|nr:13360_t:CDS:1 [Funneliformis geosporum]CAI2177158.1 17577_t:CDS:1 [Funneliformis geosporum]